MFKQGDTFLRTLTYKPGGVVMNLTGCSIASKMRAAYDNTISQVLTVAILDAVHGKFSISLTPAQTAALEPGNYSYDIELTDALGTVRTIIYGTFTVKSENTR